MGLHVDDATIREWERKGLIEAASTGQVAAPTPLKPKKLRKKDLLPSVFAPPATWVVGVETVSEANCSKKWGSIARVGKQRVAVMQVMAPHWRVWGPIGDHYRDGKPIAARITRLGCNGLDVGNLWRALKAVEDAVCLLLGTDDGDSRWKVGVHQEKFDRVGVKIELGCL